MHADELYRRQAKQEAAIAKAKEEGLPIPTFPSVLPRSTTPATTSAASIPQSGTTIPLEPDAETVESWKGKLDKLNETDRATEMEALRAEYRAKQEIVAQVQMIKEETAKEREARKAEGKETMGDRVKSIFGN